MPSYSDPGQDQQIDPQFFIAKYLIPILQHKWIVIFTTLIGLSVAIPISLLVMPEYRSTATTQVETPRAQMISEVTEEITLQTGNQAHITAAIERMYSSIFRTEVLKVIPKRLQEDLTIPLSVTGQITKKLTPLIKKILKKDLAPSIDHGAITPERLLSLSKRIIITGDNRRGTVKIEGISLDREMASVLVQSYIDVWVAMNMESNKSLIRHELEFTKKQRDEYYTQIKNSETELRLFKQKFEIPPALSSITDMELQSQLDVLQDAVANASQRYKRIDDIFMELSRKEKAVVNNIKLINPPQTPLGPSKNNRIRIILFGLFFGAVAGIAPILAWDYYRGNIRHKKDIYNAVNTPIIGKLPTIK